MNKIFFLIFLVFILTGCFKINDKSIADENKKLKICPDAWYDNQMPPVNRERTNQYFIINGSRREIYEFNVEWIKENCEVNKPKIVY